MGSLAKNPEQVQLVIEYVADCQAANFHVDQLPESQNEKVARGRGAAVASVENNEEQVRLNREFMDNAKQRGTLSREVCAAVMPGRGIAVGGLAKGAEQVRLYKEIAAEAKVFGAERKMHGSDNYRLALKGQAYAYAGLSKEAQAELGKEFATEVKKLPSWGQSDVLKALPTHLRLAVIGRGLPPPLKEQSLPAAGAERALQSGNASRYSFSDGKARSTTPTGRASSSRTG